MTYHNCKAKYRILETHFGKEPLLSNQIEQKKQDFEIVHSFSKKPNIDPPLVNFLHSREFDHFTTFTTSRPIAMQSTRRLAERFAKRFHAGEQCGIEFFWCAEPFDMREGFHFHGLIKDSSFYNSEDYRRYWENKQFFADSETQKIKVRMNYGRFDCFKINKSKNAEFYCTKYITKKLTDYDYHFRKPIY